MFSSHRDFIPLLLFQSWKHLTDIFHSGLSMFIERKAQDDSFVSEVEILEVLLHLIKNILKASTARLSSFSWSSIISSPTRHLSWS